MLGSDDGIVHLLERIKVRLPQELLEGSVFLRKVMNASHPVQNVAEVGWVSIDKDVSDRGRGTARHQSRKEGVGMEERIHARHVIDATDVQVD
jgi:hypothetical protein